MFRDIFGARPYFGTNSQINLILDDIKEALETGMLSSGSKTLKFEEMMSSLVGSKYALSVSSGGAALELVLQSLNLNGGEVLVPTDTFVATANSVIKAGGKPVFVDVDKETLCMSLDDIKTKLTAKTVGIIFVYMFGLVPSNFGEISKFCNEKSIFLLEDAAHAHGSKYGNNLAGNLGIAGCFSFYATKILTSGEGGIVTTNNREIYEKVKSLRNHGKSNQTVNYELVSNNYRIPEISSIIGIHQLKILDEILQKRQNIADKYCELLKTIPEVRILDEFINNINCSYWRFPIYISKGIDKIRLQKRMKENHSIRITWMYEPLCHKQPVFNDYISKTLRLPVSEESMKRLICLPIYPSLEMEDIIRVCESLDKELNNLM